MKPVPISVALRFARRELRGGLQGFRIFLACLALGVAAIASVQSLADAVLAGIRNDGRSILGGDIGFRVQYRDITAEQRAYLERTAETVGHFIEMRTMARADSNISDTNTLVELKAVEANYPLYGDLRLKDGIDFAGSLERRDGRWGVLIDPALAERLGVGVGDTLTIGELDYDIRAVIEREPDRVGGGGGFGFWPRVMLSLESLAQTGLLREGSMLYHRYRLKLPENIDPQRYSDDLQAAFPDNRWRIRDYRNAAPRVQRVIERLTLFLTLVGLTALLVGGVGVSNAVKAYLDNKLRTIAMLKCVGAPKHTVFQTYLAQLLVLAAAGIAIGLAIGALTPPFVGLLLAKLLPVPISVGVYPGALLLAAAFGLLTTLSFALWPLAQALDVPAGALFRAAISGEWRRPQTAYVLLTASSALGLAGLAIATAVNKAFALWFVLGALATLLVFRLAAWAVMWLAASVKRPPRADLRLALANLHRPGAATANIVLSLGLGLSVLVGIALIEGNISRQVQDAIPKKAPAFFFIDVQSDQIDEFSRLLLSVEGARDLLKVPFLRGRLVKVNGQEPEQALRDQDHAWIIRGDRGLSYAATPPENTTIVRGQWWPEDYAGPPLVSIHEEMLEAFDLELGDTLTVNVLGRDITAEISNVRSLDWRSMQLNFLMMLSPEPMRRAPHGFVATIGAATPEAETEVQRAVAKAFPSVTTVRIKEALDRVNELMSNIGTAVRAIAGITLLAGILVLAGAVAAGHSRRVYDSVVLKVLGATRRDVLRTFLLEYGLLGLITALIAAAVGTLTAWAVLTWVMDSEWIFLPSAVVSTLLLCSAITLGLGFIGTWRALGQKAAPLLRND